MVTVSRWNILEHLDSEEEIAGHIEAALEECGPRALAKAA
jgi:DNA-binding phage protein